MYDIPEGKRSTKGKSVMNFLSLSQEEKVTSVLPMPKDMKSASGSLMLVTKRGVAKKMKAASFHDVRRSGLIAVRLQKGDELIAALFVAAGNEISLVSSKGQSIRFKESDIREMGRGAAGVRAMKLSGADKVVGASVVTKESKSPELLVVTKLGYGKTTALKEYKVQKRGGSGIKTAKVTPKTGELIAGQIVGEGERGDGEAVVISQKGQVIRIALQEIPSLGRQTQGVRVMKLRPGDSIASFVVL